MVTIYTVAHCDVMVTMVTMVKFTDGHNGHKIKCIGGHNGPDFLPHIPFSCPDMSTSH